MFNKLAADPTALILGIVSLVIVLLGCCCGFLVAISLALSIVGLILAVKSLKDFDQNPENYSIQSRKNVFAAKVVCIIGVALSGLYIIIALIAFAIFGQTLTSNVFKKYYESKEINRKFGDTTATKNEIDKVLIDTTTVISDSVIIKKDN